MFLVFLLDGALFANRLLSSKIGYYLKRISISKEKN